MKSYLTYREKMAGVFIFSGLLLITIFIVGAAIQNLWFTPTVLYHAFVTRGEGLRQGSPVLLSGIDIGRVGDMDIMSDGRIDITLLIHQKYSYRIIEGTRAEIRRTIGLGEKRVLLYIPEDAKNTLAILPQGANIPADEPKDLIDAIAHLDLTRYLDTLDRAVTTLDTVLEKFEQEDRLLTMLDAFDKFGPTMDTMNNFFTRVEEPFVSVLSDPSFIRAFRGTARFFNDPKTQRLVHNLSESLDPEKIDALLTRSETMIANMDKMLQQDNAMQKTFEGANRILNDGRLENLISSLDKLSNTQKIERLISNMDVLTSQMAKIGPDIPVMTKEMNITMRELTIVLRALQRTWLLDDETEEVLKQMKLKR